MTHGHCALSSSGQAPEICTAQLNRIYNVSKKKLRENTAPFIPGEVWKEQMLARLRLSDVTKGLAE